FRHRKISVK
nr:Chain X, Epl1 arginine anchor [Saccharomyces cerevisiae]